MFSETYKYNQFVQLGVSKDILKYSKRFQNCPLCMEIFNSKQIPALLSCGHLICKQCWDSEHKCFYPDCKEKVQVKILSFSKFVNLSNEIDQKTQMTIGVRSLRSSQIQIQRVKLGDKIKQSKVISKMINTSAACQRAIIVLRSKSYLYMQVESKSWKQIGAITQNLNQIYYVLLQQRFCGGAKAFGIVDLKFNSTQNVEYVKFNQLAPAWRLVSKGLNLKGKCKNPSCKAYNEIIWIHKGFDKFLINKQIQISECPICKQVAKQITNFGYYNCKIKIQGMIRGQNNQKPINVFKQDFHDGKGEIKTFKQEGESEMKNWVYLFVTVEKLPQDQDDD